VLTPSWSAAEWDIASCSGRLLYGIGELILETLVGYERLGYSDYGNYIAI